MGWAWNPPRQSGSAEAMEGLLAIEQRPVGRDAAPWVRERGYFTLGHENDKRIAELRKGLQAHHEVRIEAASADDDTVESVLCRLHDPGYLEAIRSVASDRAVVLDRVAAPGTMPDIPVNAGLVAAAHEGIRVAITAAERLLTGARCTYALCRPPGHHAGPAWCGGYCYLNNAAAAAHVLSGSGAASVALVDLDLHYGNGTAAIIAAMPSTAMWSLHEQRRGAPSPDPFSPREHQIAFTSAPTAEDYLAALAAAIEDFDPDTSAVVVSLGYDTVVGDPHGAWRFPPTIFASIGRLLRETCLPLCIVQEGGYALRALAPCSQAFAGGLLDDDPLQ